MLPHHLTVTPSGVYKYRRRTPQELKQFIGSHEIIRSLGKSPNEAITKASDLTRVISEAIQLTQLSSVPSSVIQDLLNNHNLITTNDGKRNPKETKGTLKEIAEMYLRSLSVSKEEVRDRGYILLEVYPAIFEALLNDSNPSLVDIKYTHLIKARDLLQLFPKRNIEKYRQTPLKDITKGLHANTMVIPVKDRIGITTLNKYIKWFSVLLSFAVKQSIIPFNTVTSGLTIKKVVNSRGQRKEFSTDELQIIEDVFRDEPIYPVVKILRYTGMRPSELLKCSLTEIDGVLCFDLRTPTKALKTLSSHRLIPIHSSLKDSVEGFQELLNSYAEQYITKRFATVIQKHLEDSKSKSMYSLRHTFATNLIAKGVQPEVVSELMGHAHTTMTMNRYVKGYPIKVLKEAIENL